MKKIEHNVKKKIIIIIMIIMNSSTKAYRKKIEIVENFT